MKTLNFPVGRAFLLQAQRRQGAAMFTSAISKSVTVVAVAGLIAGLVALSMSAIPEAKAQPQPAVAAKGDKLPMRVRGTACSQRSWPYYDQSCQFDLRRSANDAGDVRLIGLR
jgi:hypothetical protein